MDKRIESYLDSVIPEKLSKRRQKLIREELRDHISDHIDFYTEIGYSEDESIQKALADMGDDGGVTAMVKKDFEKVYGEKIWMPILAFVLTVGIGSLLYLFASFLFGTSFRMRAARLSGSRRCSVCRSLWRRHTERASKKRCLQWDCPAQCSVCRLLLQTRGCPLFIRALLTRSSMTAVIYWKNNADIIISGN